MLKKLNRTTTNIAQNRPVKVLQFGGGNFLRGFADWIIDVLNEKTEFNGAIDIVTSITPGTAEQINEQDGLYYLVQQGNKNAKPFSEHRLITAVNRAINPSTQLDTFLFSADNPNLRFVISNTTESGIAFDEADTSVTVLPKSFPGKLTQLLYRRFEYFNGAADKTLIILPCELIDANGDSLKKIVYQYVTHWNLSSRFREWVDQNIFCNTLVDRIVPGFPKEGIEKLQNETGFEDGLVVAAEPFYFWAIEAPEQVRREFPTHRAGLTNVVFTNDITPYRVRKVRILNGAHTAMMAVAYLRGLRTVKEAMDDVFVGNFIKETIQNEIIPTLTLPAEELHGFARDVEDRFSNPYIKHLLLSISLNSISKFKVRVLPTIFEYIRVKQILPPNLIMSFAALICFYKGTWKNEIIPLNDSPDVIAKFQKAWDEKSVDNTVKMILQDVVLWGQDLTQTKGFSEAVTKEINHLSK